MRTTQPVDVDLADLVDDCLAGDQRAWRRLVDRFSPLVWTVVRSHRLSVADSQDAYQLTWMRVVENLPKLRSPRHFAQWITTTARRESLKQIARSRGHLPVGDSDLLEGAARYAEPTDETVVRRAGRDLVLAAFRRLPARDQLLLGLLMADAPPSYEEVSRVLGVPRGSIGPLRGRALSRLCGLIPASALARDGDTRDHPTTEIRNG